jgi:hypothetical protein
LARLNFLGGNFAYDVVEGGFRDAIKIAAEQNLARADSFRRGGSL